MKNQQIDPYAVLDVSKDADDEEIKRAFRKKSFACHPDLYPNDPQKTEEFRLLDQSYKMVETEEKRRQLRQRSGVILSKGVMSAVSDFWHKFCRVKTE